MQHANIVYPTLIPELMPESSVYEFARSTFWNVVEAMKNPKFNEEYEAWKKERDQRQNVAQKGEE